MHIDEHHDWMDGFETWEEVETCLHDDWVRVVDLRQRLELERDLDDLVVVEVDHRLRARQRRELHRLGFRPVAAGRCTEWRWDLVQAVRTADATDFPHPLLSSYERVPAADRPRSYELLRTKVVEDGLVGQQVRSVVQEVFRSAPADLAVVAYRDSALWDEDDDDDDEEDWERPTG